GIDKQPVWLGLSSFLAGGAVFAAIDSALAKSGAPLSMLVAMMMDFAPESLVLGAVAAADPAQAVFLAVVIGAQNLPEGFNAYREIRSAHAAYLSRHVMRFMAICSLAGPAAAVVGLYAFAPDSPALGFVMTFCAGGVLYLVMRDIAPRAGDGPDWWPAYGAVAGFGVGLAGHAVIG
ncbi:MAG: divalent cation transporter, partial [Pseudomonadota bacterium]